jgi:hypothetical protein
MGINKKVALLIQLLMKKIKKYNTKGMNINERVTELKKLARHAKTDRERLVLMAEIEDLLSCKIELMDKELNSIQCTLRQVTADHMPDSGKKQKILNLDYADRINEIHYSSGMFLHK